MRRLLFAATVALAGLSGVAGCAKDKAVSEKAGEVPNISIDDVDRGLAAKQLVAIDCNGDKTRKKHGVLPGAILITDEEEFVASELPSDKTTKLVFYCSGPG